uniref:Chromatin complexes subunit BAP18 n=1 Tax=Panagrellus redivivus TaxID=6233 RepID=A0A7E4VRR4_PANRE
MDRISGLGAPAGGGPSTTTSMYAHQSSTSSPAPHQQYSTASMPGGSAGYHAGPSNPGPSVPPGASPSNADGQLGGASMNKLTEVFMTASFAFQRLGDITMQITASAGNPDEMKWSEKDAERLSQAIKQFADECDKIHTDVRSRTGQMIKTDFKRRTIQVNQQNAANSLIGSYNPNGRSPGPGASTSYGTPMSHYNGMTTLSSMAPTTSTGSYTLAAQKRPGTSIVGGPPKRIISSGGTTFRTINSSSLAGPSGLRGTGGVIRPMGGGTHLRVVHANAAGGEGSQTPSYSGHRLVPANRQLPANQYYEQLDAGSGGGSTSAINPQPQGSARSASVASNASGSGGGPSSSAPVLQQMTSTAASSSAAQY